MLLETAEQYCETPFLLHHTISSLWYANGELTRYRKPVIVGRMATRKKRKVPATISKYFAKIGRRGGKAKVPKGIAALTPAERTERARQALKSRWGKK